MAEAPAAPTKPIPLTPEQEKELLFLRVSASQGYPHVENWFRDAADDMTGEADGPCTEKLLQIESKDIPDSYEKVSLLREQRHVGKETMLAKLQEIRSVHEREMAIGTVWLAGYTAHTRNYLEVLASMEAALLDRRMKASKWLHGEREVTLAQIARYEEKRRLLAKRVEAETTKIVTERIKESSRLCMAFESCLEEVRDVVGWYVQQPHGGEQMASVRRRQILEILGLLPRTKLKDEDGGDELYEMGREGGVPTTALTATRHALTIPSKASVAFPPTAEEKCGLWAEKPLRDALQHLRRQHRDRHPPHDTAPISAGEAAAHARLFEYEPVQPLSFFLRGGGAPSSSGAPTKKKAANAVRPPPPKKPDSNNPLTPSISGIERLTQVLDSIDVRPKPKPCSPLVVVSAESFTKTTECELGSPMTDVTFAHHSGPKGCDVEKRSENGASGVETASPIRAQKLNSTSGAAVPSSGLAWSLPPITRATPPATLGATGEPVGSVAASLLVSADDDRTDGIPNQSSVASGGGGRPASTSPSVCGNTIASNPGQQTAPLPTVPQTATAQSSTARLHNSRPSPKSEGFGKQRAMTTRSTEEAAVLLAQRRVAGHHIKKPPPPIVSPPHSGGIDGAGFTTDHLMHLAHTLSGEAADATRLIAARNSSAISQLQELRAVQAAVAAVLDENVILEKTQRRRRSRPESRGTAAQAAKAHRTPPSDAADDGAAGPEELKCALLSDEQSSAIEEMNEFLSRSRDELREAHAAIADFTEKITTQDAWLRCVQDYWRVNAATFKRASNASTAAAHRRGSMSPAAHPNSSHNSCFSSAHSIHETAQGSPTHSLSRPNDHACHFPDSADSPNWMLRYEHLLANMVTYSPGALHSVAPSTPFSAGCGDPIASMTDPEGRTFSSRETSQPLRSTLPQDGVSLRTTSMSASAGVASPLLNSCSGRRLPTPPVPMPPSVNAAPAVDPAPISAAAAGAMCDPSDSDALLTHGVVPIHLLQLHHVDQVAEFIYSVFESE